MILIFHPSIHPASATYTLKKTSGPESAGWVLCFSFNLGFALIKTGGGKCELRTLTPSQRQVSHFYVAVQVAVSPNRPRLLAASAGQMLVGERRGKNEVDLIRPRL